MEESLQPAGLVRLGHYHSGPYRLDVRRFGPGVCLTVNGEADFFFFEVADGAFTGAGYCVDRAWALAPPDDCDECAGRPGSPEEEAEDREEIAEIVSWMGPPGSPECSGTTNADPGRCRYTAAATPSEGFDTGSADPRRFPNTYLGPASEAPVP